MPNRLVLAGVVVLAAAALLVWGWLEDVRYLRYSLTALSIVLVVVLLVWLVPAMQARRWSDDFHERYLDARVA